MEPCGNCPKFCPIERANRSKSGGKTKLKHGYCLKDSVFATNRTDAETIPIGAKRDILPNGVHQSVIVRADEIKPQCPRK